jgi:hypothetical protein
MKNALAGFLALVGAACIIGARIAGIHMTAGELLIEFWWLFAIGTLALAIGAWLWRRATNARGNRRKDRVAGFASG